MDANCTLSVNEFGSPLDRICALEKLIPQELIDQVLDATGKVQKRRCRLTYSTTLWIVLGMAIYTGYSIKDVFRNCRRKREEEEVPTRSALCKARQRLGSKVFRELFRQVAQPLCDPQRGFGFYQRFRLMGIDGLVLTVPDTPANEKAFGRPKGGYCSESQGGFPLVGKVMLVELGSHAECAFAVRSQSQGESTMAVRLVKHLTPEMLVLLDAGFFGYLLLSLIFRNGTNFICNVSSTPLLEPIEQLSDGTYIAGIYPTTKQRKKQEGGLRVRVLDYTLNDPRRPGHGQRRRLVTTLLDEVQFTAMELICLYHERWEHELTNDEQKTHQDPRRAEKPTHLRSETPAGVVQELTALALGHYAIRKTMYDAAVEASVDPDRISFKASLNIIRTRLPECRSASPPVIEDWYRSLIKEIAQEQLEKRRNRINPRVIKRARCKWPTKKPDDYNPPQPTKTFEEVVVLRL